MRNIFTAFIALVFSSALLADDSPPALQVAFEANCIQCHGKNGKVKGKVNLLKLRSDNDLLAKPELLEKLLTVLKDHAMPPEDEPPLPAATRTQMVEQLQSLFRQALKTQAFEPTQMRRMNRFQYNNAVVDLLELDRDIFRLNERLMRRRDKRCQLR